MNDYRLHFIAIGIEKYLNCGDDMQLPSTIQEITLVRNAFEEKLGYTSRLPQIRLNATKADIEIQLGDWLSQQDLDQRDVVAIYFTGHALVGEDKRHHLLTSDYRESNLLATSLTTEQLVSLLAHAHVKHALVILDTCASGQGALDGASSMARFGEGPDADRNPGSGYWLVAASRPREEATVRVFAEALVETIDNPAFAGEGQRFLDISAVIAAVNPKLANSGQSARFAVVHGSGTSPSLPNPRFNPLVPLGIDVATQRRIASQQDLQGYWSPRARGVEVEGQPGNFFCGRSQVLRDIEQWLRCGTKRGLLVTGNPGSGKSAILARILLLSDPVSRDSIALPNDDIDADLLFEYIRGGVYCRNKSFDEVISELGGLSGYGVDVPVQDMIEVLSSKLPGSVYILDGLDESDDAGRVIKELIIPVVRSPNGARILLGVRRYLTNELSSVVQSIDIDEEEYVQLKDLALYAEMIIQEPLDNQASSRYLKAPGKLLDAITTEIAKSSYPTFLIARLTARSLARADARVDPLDPSWVLRLPKSVEAAMEADLSRYGAERIRVTEMLRPLAMARGLGLPWDGLWAGLATALSESGAVYTDEQIEWLMEHAGGYIVNTLEDGRSVYRLYHQALIDYLRDPPLDRHRQTMVFRSLVDSVPLLEGCRTWEAAHPYILQHLASHASEVGTLSSLLEDEWFCVNAEPRRLIQALSASRRLESDWVEGTKSSRVSKIYENAFHALVGTPIPERVSYLAHSSMQLEMHEFRDLAEKAGVAAGWLPRRALSRGSHLEVITEVRGEIQCMAIADLEGQPALVVGDHAGIVHCWAYASMELLWESMPFSDASITVVGSSASYSNGIVCASSNGGVAILDLRSGRTTWRAWPEVKGGIFAATLQRISRGRAVVITGGHDGVLRVTAEDDSKPIVIITSQEWWISAILLARLGDREIICCAGGDGDMCAYDLRGKRLDEKSSFEGNGQVSCLEAIHGMPNVVAAGTEEGSLILFRLKDGKPLVFRTGSFGGVVSLTCRPASNGMATLLAVYASGAVIAYDVRGSNAPQLGEGNILVPSSEDWRSLAYVHAAALFDWAGETIVALAGSDGHIHSMSLGGSSLQPSKRVMGSPLRLASEATFSSSTLVITQDANDDLEAFDVQSGERIWGPITSEGASPMLLARSVENAGYVAILDEQDGEVLLYSAITGKFIDRGWLSNSPRSLSGGYLEGDPIVVGWGVQSLSILDFRDSGEIESRELCDFERAISDVRSYQVDESIRILVASGGQLFGRTIAPARGKSDAVLLLPWGEGAVQLAVSSDGSLTAVADDNGNVTVHMSSTGAAVGPRWKAAVGPLSVFLVAHFGGQPAVITVEEDSRQFRVWRIWGVEAWSFKASAEILHVAVAMDSACVVTRQGLSFLRFTTEERS
jgi:WD40 repeat protein